MSSHLHGGNQDGDSMSDRIRFTGQPVLLNQRLHRVLES